MTWRAKAEQSIREVIDAHPGIAGPQLMDMILAHCPMGKDAHFLQKLWRKEVQVALGIAKRRKQSR